MMIKNTAINPLDYSRTQGKIELLNSTVERIYKNASNQNRGLTDEEKKVAYGLQDEIDRFRAEIDDTPSPRTVGGFSAKPSNGAGFQNFGDQLRAVAHAGMPGGKIDPRLYNAATGLNETVPSEGGFVVQTDYSNELLKEVYQTSLLAEKCRRLQISGNSNSIKINGFDETSRASTRFGGVLGYWADEAAEKTASKPKFRQMELQLKKLIGLCYSSDELLADTTALAQVIQSAFVSEFGFQLDDAIINGSGVGQPLGILNAGCLVSVGKEAGQAAATVVAENVIKMWSRLLPGSESRAVWLCNKNVLPQLLQLSLAVGTGGIPVYMPQNQIAGMPYQSLFGRPVIFCEQCATLGTQGDIILADLQDGYILAEKGGIKSDMSIHVRFIYDESVFRFVLRVDGQPALASALTPYKGGATNTQSHFVVLDARS